VTTALFDTQPAIADTADTLGVIGTRQLVAVQTFDIARLTSHPVAVIPSSFVAVTGRGPRDSNESGKTSFNAAVALLLGDPEWRVTGGGVAAVAELLFEPDTAGVAAARYPAAQTGFIVGVFAEPDDVEGTAYTAWMKVSSTPKYLLVRHAPGVHLVMADTDIEQHRQAPAVWASLPVASELGAHTYVDTLYGRSPRCLAYVTARGKQRSGPSLLKMDTGAFTPADIGAALMRLTGRSETLETERDQRRKLAQQTGELAETKSDHERMWAQEEEALRGVRLRTVIRDKLAAGRHLWHQHLARGLLDTLIRRDALQAELDDARARAEEGNKTLTARLDAETALTDETGVAERAANADEALQVASQRHTEASNKVAVLTSNAATIRQELTDLEEKGARDFHLDVTAATTALESSREERAKADARAKTANEKVSALEEQLTKAAAGRLGDVGRVIEILDAAPVSIDAVGLLDAVEVADDHRDLWEARLLPWRDAVCIPAIMREVALVALAHNPGSVVISGPTSDLDPLGGEPGEKGHLPEGLLAAPSTAVPFLTRLAERAHASETLQVTTARDHELGVDVIGGFSGPITGRAHIMAVLEHQLRDAREEQELATEAAGLAKRLHKQAEDDLASAQAAEHYRARAAELRRVETEDLPKARDQEVKRKDDLDSALEDHTQAQSDLRGLEAARAHARKQREEAESELSAARTEAARAQRALEDVDLGYWVAGFGGTDSEARTTLNWADDPLETDAGRQIAYPPGPRDPSQPVEKRTRDTLRNRANECLTEIITKLDIERATGHGSPTREIAEAVRRREHLADSSGTPLGRDEIGFTGLADALGEWLLHMQERDELAEEQISTARQQREAEIAFSEQRLAGLANGLANIQDSLEQRIESNLTAISDALNRLNKNEGFGACLEWEVIRPTGPDDSWTWKVVPMWRRSPGGKMLPYNNATNSAQEKLFSVHLVLAALLASPNARGRVLILDELGDSLGEEHRRDVLTAVSEVAREYGITVLGTCQDAVMPDAAAYCGEILYFCYPSKAEALNLPTRMFGYDRNRQRVELTADALLAGRPWT
jgi:hypothetical protein